MNMQPDCAGNSGFSPGEARQGKSSTTRTVLIVLACVAGALVVCCGVGTVVMLPALGKARQAAREAVASSNLRLLSTSVFAYAAENKDRLPPADTWQEALRTHMSMQPAEFDQFLDSPRIDGPGPDFLFSPPLPPSGGDWLTFSDVQFPPQTVMFHEDPARLPAALDLVCVVMFDGSTATMTREELRRALEKQRKPGN